MNKGPLGLPKPARVCFTMATEGESAHGGGGAAFARITMRGTCARWRKRRGMPNQTRRLLALAAIYDGASRRAAAAIGGVGGRRCVSGWLAFNAHGPSGLIDGKAPGNRPLLNPEQREALRRIVEAGPNPAVDGVVRWRLIDLAQWVYAEFRISISKQTLSRMLRGLGYRKLSARPRHHAQDPAALEAFKKTLPRVWRRSRNMRPQASR